jgi:CRISPR-associated protein Cas1
VKSKIRAQGLLLLELYGKDRGLRALAKKVKSGDVENLEGQASRRYWPALFNDPDFQRRRDAEDQNRFLNYGYAILRAIVARGICAAGLHPSLGIHHHNRYDAFCLADDLMEPFRAIVDRAVVRWVAEHGKDSEMCKEAKAAMLGALMERYDLEGEQRTLFDISSRLASSLAQVFLGEREKLALPDFSAIFGNGAVQEGEDVRSGEDIEV